jgi:hypothetical protein
MRLLIQIVAQVLAIRNLLLTIVVIFGSCASLVPNTAPTSAEMSQLNKDRHDTVAYVIQCLKDQRELVDTSMNRLHMEKLRNDYSQVKDIDDALINLLSKSITVGNDPSGDYPMIIQAMSAFHQKAVDLQAYIRSVAPVRRSGAYVLAGSHDPTYKYVAELPSPTIRTIWNNWQLRQSTQRDRTQNELQKASLAPFKTLADTFGP